MVELQPSKLATWVRFPSPAPIPLQTNRIKPSVSFSPAGINQLLTPTANVSTRIESCFSGVWARRRPGRMNLPAPLRAVVPGATEGLSGALNGGAGWWCARRARGRDGGHNGCNCNRIPSSVTRACVDGILDLGLHPGDGLPSGLCIPAPPRHRLLTARVGRLWKSKA